MRKFLCLLAGMLALLTGAMGQVRTVSGRVTDARTNDGLPGVTVTQRGTSNATQTGADGSFTLSNLPSNAVLVFSSVGFKTQTVTVGTNSTISLNLEQESGQLSEVVVTALGQAREKKQLGYSTTTVRNEEINRVSPVSVFDGLQGRIAGADISNVSGAPGGSTKVVLRGYSSLAGTNQPLYIVDGVPVSDVRPGSEGVDPDYANKNNIPGYDLGNTINDINPADIESLTVLKGAGATSLYGSRATNGVIIITTRRGRAGRIKVDVNSTMMFSQPNILPKMQEQFGQGWDGTFIPSENGSWGPRLDGKPRLWGAPVDNSQLLKPYSFVKDNLRDAYETGREFNNAISMSGGNENSTFLLSYNNVYNDGIIPSANDRYRRNAFSMRGTTRYKGFTAEASFNYINRTQRAVESGQSASGVGGSFFEQLLQIPVDIPISQFRDYKNKFYNVDNYFTPFAENPYYTLFENGSQARNDRFYGNINLLYKVTDWATLQVQQGVDITNSVTKSWRNKNSPTAGSWNAGNNPESAARSANIGNVQEGSQKYWEYDTKVDVQVKKDLGRIFSVDGIAGFNYNERGSDVLYTYVEDLAVPGFYDISNGKTAPRSTNARTKQAIAGLFASATLGYEDYLYLTLSARNDWSSTLPKGNNSFFYPSANVSFLLSNLWDLQARTPISYAKIRASVGQTGKDAPVHQVFNTLGSTNITLPFGQILFPFEGVAGYSIADNLGNTNLEPEITTDYEAGAELGFLDNRIGIDVAYYNRTSKGQIIRTPISPSTGYTQITLNFGKIRNQGIELSARFTPIRTRDFTWDLNYVFTRNRNKVLELPSGLDKVTLNSAYDANLEARQGQPLGVLYAPVPRYDPQGRIIVNPNTGYPEPATEDGYFGNIQRDYTMGLNSSMTYKNFRLAFSFDYRKGGVFYSSTSELLLFTGNHYLTTYNDRKPFVIPNSVNEVIDNTGKATYVENKTVIDEIHQDDYYYFNSNRADFYRRTILDKTFLKLRDVTLSYTLPGAWASRIKADRIVITLIGRNLWTLLPEGNSIIDPETSNFGRDLASELGEFRVGPTARSFGGSLRISF